MLEVFLMLGKVREISYKINESKLSQYPGEPLVFSIDVAGLATGARIYWRVVGDGVLASHFTDNTLSGSGTLSNGTITVTRTLKVPLTGIGGLGYKLLISSIAIPSTELEAEAISDPITLMATPSGSITLTSVGYKNWTVPVGVYRVSVSAKGGGGGGGGGATGWRSATGGKGGNGALGSASGLTVYPGQVLVAYVGAGGAGGKSGYRNNGSPGSPGSVSNLKIGTNVYAVASGGGGGAGGNEQTGATGTAGTDATPTGGAMGGKGGIGPNDGIAGGNGQVTINW